jgi:hypothetical protein
MSKPDPVFRFTAPLTTLHPSQYGFVPIGESGLAGLPAESTSEFEFTIFCTSTPLAPAGTEKV